MPRRALAGLVLCAFLLAATWPTLAALPSIPAQIVAGDVYVVTQGSEALSVNDSLLENLTTRAWAVRLSAEVISLGTLQDEPIVIRGAEPDPFLAIERGMWVTSSNASGRWASAGEGLANRLGLGVGTFVTLLGSSLPRLVFAPITGIYRTSTLANDELLVDLRTARELTGVGPMSYHSIRVETSDPAGLLAFLDAFGSSVHVNGPGLAREDIHSDPPTDERIANFILRTGRGGAPRDYLADAVDEAVTSVRVVAVGIAALLAGLVAFGVHAVQARAFADRRAAIGVLRAVGAGDRWMRRRMLAETVPLAVLATGIGIVLGSIAAVLLRPSLPLVLFGHEVLPTLDLGVVAALFLAVVAISTTSSLLLLQGSIRMRPSESIRDEPGTEPPMSLEVVTRG